MLTLPARVVGARFTRPGLVGRSIAAILVGVLRDQAALDWSRFAAWWAAWP